MLQIGLFNRILILCVCLVGLTLALPNAFYSRVEMHNDALTREAQNLPLTPEERAAAQSWPGFLPSALMNLGLDLRGGAHLLAEIQIEEVYASRMDAYWPEVRDALRDERPIIGTIRRQNGPEDELWVRIGNPDGLAVALQTVRGLARPIVDVSGLGATDIEVTGLDDLVVVTFSEAQRVAIAEQTLQTSLEVIRRRVDEAGTREPTIQRQGADRILIQVPGLGSAQELKELIGTTAQLTFHPVVRVGADANARVSSTEILRPDADEAGLYYVLERTPIITGENLVDANLGFDQNGLPAVTFRLNPAGGAAFGLYTTENVGALFAPVLDGEVITAPRINEPITGGSAQITGNFTVPTATALAIQLRAGALPAELVFLEERTIGPELGQDSIDAGQTAAIVALIAVIVFMILSYGLFGVFANLALLINVGLIVGILSLLGGTLTLPGIAGIVLTIGMAVDANVLVFERIREEMKTARGPARAIELGYEKALSAILDANITTFIIAAILFVFGSGPVKGFAVTLGIGILTSVFTAIFVTRLLIVVWFEYARPKKLEV